MTRGAQTTTARWGREGRNRRCFFAPTSASSAAAKLAPSPPLRARQRGGMAIDDARWRRSIYLMFIIHMALTCLSTLAYRGLAPGDALNISHASLRAVPLATMYITQLPVYLQHNIVAEKAWRSAPTISTPQSLLRAPQATRLRLQYRLPQRCAFYSAYSSDTVHLRALRGRAAWAVDHVDGDLVALLLPATMPACVSTGLLHLCLLSPQTPLSLSPPVPLLSLSPLGLCYVSQHVSVSLLQTSSIHEGRRDLYGVCVPILHLQTSLLKKKKVPDGI